MFAHMTPKKMIITDPYNSLWKKIWMCHFLKTFLEYFGQLGLEGIDECWIWCVVDHASYFNVE